MPTTNLTTSQQARLAHIAEMGGWVAASFLDLPSNRADRDAPLAAGLIEPRLRDNRGTYEIARGA